MSDKQYPGSYYQPLFDLMNQEHGLVLLESEMTDIIQVVKKMEHSTHREDAAGSGKDEAVAFQNWIHDCAYIFNPYKSEWQDVKKVEPVTICKTTPELYDIFKSQNK